MRTIFKLLLCLLAMSLGRPAHAQKEEKPVGFVRLVNAIGQGKGPARFSIDGRQLSPAGYKLGRRTGGLALEVGEHEIIASCNGVEDGSTTVKVVAGQTMNLIAFAELQQAEREGEPPVWKTRILRLKQGEAPKGYHLTVTSVSAAPDVTFTIATAARRSFELKTVKRFGTIGVDLGKSRGDVEMRLHRGEGVLAASPLGSPGNYVSVIYDDGKGDIRAMIFYDPQLYVTG